MFREDATLITIYANGALEIHIIRRKANFSKKQNDQISKTHEKSEPSTLVIFTIG